MTSSCPSCSLQYRMMGDDAVAALCGALIKNTNLKQILFVRKFKKDLGGCGVLLWLDGARIIRRCPFSVSSVSRVHQPIPQPTY